jgi:hypothetical protein
MAGSSLVCSLLIRPYFIIEATHIGLVQPLIHVGFGIVWLESDESGDWLMILDNADDVDALFPRHTAQTSSTRERKPPATGLATYLPRNTRGAMLITSRSRDTAIRLTGNQERVIKIDRMNIPEATALLAKKEATS